MNKQAAIAAACALTGDPVEAVLSHRLTGDTLTLVIDRGIKGAPKFEYDLSELSPSQPPLIAPEPEPETKPEPATRRRRKVTK